MRSAGGFCSRASRAKPLWLNAEPGNANFNLSDTMFRAIKRLFIWLGLMAEKATENDAINAAVVERGIRDAKARADKAGYANGQLAAQSALLKEQLKKQQRQKEELIGLLQAAAAANDEGNGAHYAEELAQLEQDLNDNESQLQSLESLYKQNTEIIAQSLREVQKFEREFQQVKARVAVSKQLEGLSVLMKSSVTELQGMIGGEVAQSMQQLRQTAASGEGQMRATMDLAREVGSGIARQQEMRKARGKMLFDQYKQKMGMVQPEAESPEQQATPERQKIAE
jgi:phage shock protein A